MSANEQLEWMNAGGSVVHRGGKRPWKAVKKKQ